MVRIAKKTDPKRISELKKKIQDREYVEEAIQKIAQRLSAELVGTKRSSH
jgi:hypothetical protein